MLKKIYKIIATTLIVASIAMLIWVSASYVEVCCKNLTEAPTYSNWNCFQLLVEYGR